MTELQWFLTEQVEEEKETRREWVCQVFGLVGRTTRESLLDLDRELGTRNDPLNTEN